MKNEELLHYVWQYQLFHTQNLKTTCGKDLKIIKTGHPHSDSGPDFINAHLLLDGIFWAGKVEIHWASSEWFKHHHQTDPNYDAVILHVVWIHDKEIFRLDGSSIPTLVLKDIVAEDFKYKYKNLKSSTNEIPCQAQIQEIDKTYIISMQENALAHRFDRKREEVLNHYEETHRDLNETAYRLFMKAMGLYINEEAFTRLSRILPYSLLSKYKSKLIALEALLFGAAGFLDEPIDLYSQTLRKEFDFLSHKHELSDRMCRADWKFLRTRPQNFPTLKLALTANCIATFPSWFQLFTEELNIPKVLPSSYWCEHYDFAKKGGFKCSISHSHLNINVIIPLLLTFQTIDSHYYLRAMNILEKTRAENNFITRKWAELGIKSQTAWDSQALLEQHMHFCKNKKCLKCPVGAQILFSH